MSAEPRDKGKHEPILSRVWKRVIGQMSVSGRSHCEEKGLGEGGVGMDAEQHWDTFVVDPSPETMRN